MSIVPRYDFPSGTEVTLHNQKMALRSKTADGYELKNVETGEISITSFSKFVELMNSPVMSIENPRGTATDIVSLRLGGLKVAEQLPVGQQEHGRFHHAICRGASALRNQLRKERSQPNLQLTGPLLNDEENRKYICRIATDILGKTVSTSRIRGGRSKEWVLYRGRTILKYLAIFDELASDDDVIAALATRDHLKGNQDRRFSYRLLDLMTQAWEEIGFDEKVSSVANAHKRLEALVYEENKKRNPNETKQLIVPSHKSLRAHRNLLVSPTEYLVAIKGERHGRNKRGRGSSDTRALLPGELVEVDECKLSLISSAKKLGRWENMSSKAKMKLEEIDKEIRLRLALIVVIDVATRMPLAWILSDQPRAEATLAALRMATRDKTKEKTKYGCTGDPVPALGIASMKSDSGPGLRNNPVASSLIGTGTSYTTVRTYAPADKPFVERLFGTLEANLIEQIHGYTGHKAGELPGYDSNENGVLDTDELYGMLTRFFIDEYPSMRHMGVGMGGKRPAEVLKELNATRGLFRPMNEDDRRIHLGWKEEVTPNDEGVRVLSGVWYNSNEFQIAVDKKPGAKVSVFIDPDNLNEATAVIPGVEGTFRLQLQITAFRDLTAPEALDVTQAFRREHPDITEIHEDRLATTRSQRFDQLRKIGIENNLARIYSTAAECNAKAAKVFAGSRIVQTAHCAQTVHPGEINSCLKGPGVFQIGEDEGVVERNGDDVDTQKIRKTRPKVKGEKRLSDSGHAPVEKQRKTKSIADKHKPLGRPKKKGKFK
nr:hypothetical protein [uncultured Shimia sp.]